jgi:alpha/beta hydrolase family protein
MCATPSSKLNDPGSRTNSDSGKVGRTVMEKFVLRKESNTLCVLDRSHGLNEITAFRVHRRCQIRCTFGQVVSRLDRSILLMIAGLFLSVSAFSQTPGGPAGLYPANERTIQSPTKQDDTPVDPQVKLIAYRMLAARVFLPFNFEEPRQADFLHSKFAGSPESVFHVQDREIPGGTPVRLYKASARTGPPLWVFLYGGDFVADKLDTYDMPLRAVTNGCDCPVVSVGYQLALENRYPASPRHVYAATKWVAEHAAETDQNPKTPLSAMPPGTFGLPPTPGSAQTPASEAYRAGGNIDLTSLAAHFRVGLLFRKRN